MNTDKVFWALYNQLLTLADKQYDFSKDTPGEYLFKYTLSAKNYREEIIIQIIKSFNQIRPKMNLLYEVLDNDYVLLFSWNIETEEQKISNAIQKILLDIKECSEIGINCVKLFQTDSQQNRIIFDKILNELIKSHQKIEITFDNVYENLMTLKIYPKEKSDDEAKGRASISAW